MEDEQWPPLGVEAGLLGETRSWAGVLSVSGWLLLPLALTLAFQRMSASSLPQTPGPGWVGCLFSVCPNLSPYLDHDMVTLLARLPSRITARVPVLALCTLLSLCQALRWLLNMKAETINIPLSWCALCPLDLLLSPRLVGLVLLPL